MRIANIVFNSFVNDNRVLKESISLKKAGYEVEIIAHGDKDLPKEEIKNRIKIKRFNYLDRKITTSKLSKLKIYLLWLKDVVKYVKNFDVLHCNDLNTLPIAFIVKKFFNKNVKVVYDAHEYETEMNQLNKISKPLAKFAEKFLIKYVDKVITVSESIANEYKKLYPFIEKPALVLNTPPYKKIEKKDLFREKLGIDENKMIFLYQGGLSSGRGIEILLETFKQIENKDAVIVFMGYGPLEKEVKEASKKYSNIYFHPAVSPEILLDYTSSADFGILFYENTCLNHYYCSPNKMFEYLMSEIPVIVSNLYEMKRLVEKYKIGVVARENSVEGLKEAIEEAVKLDKEELRRNIQEVKKVYNWEEQEKVLLKIYREL